VQNERFVGNQGTAEQPVTIDLSLPDTLSMSEPAQLTVELAEDGVPVEGAVVEIEGNMTHAGMEPVFVIATEREAGQYVATLDWTMGGEWFLIIRATLPGGESVERTIDNLEVITP
jgi:hypothetical protein